MSESINSIGDFLRQYRGKRTLVLGAGGFIGRWVARQLTVAGAELFLPLRNVHTGKRTFTEYEIRGTILKHDLLDLAATKQLIREIDPEVTFNLAGYGVCRSERSEVLSYKINADLVAAVCSAIGTCHDFSPPRRRVIHVGSALEYGNAGGDLSENTDCDPTTIYGRSKLAGTRALSQSCEEYGIRGVTARLFTVYGPGEDASRLLPTLIASSEVRGQIDLTDGLHKRDFTYVEDVAEALLRLGSAETEPGEIVNVATGSLSSVREFVNTAASVLGLPADRLNFGALPTRPEEMKHDDVSILRLKELTGWLPSTGVGEGVAKTLSFARAELGLDLALAV